MKQTNNIKKTEKKIVLFFMTFFLIIKNAIHSFLLFLLSIGKQNITIMFIPHSEKRVFNFRCNIFALFTVILISISAITITVYFGIDHFHKQNLYLDAKTHGEQNEKIAAEYQDMMNEVIEEHSFFQRKLNDLIDQLNTGSLKKLIESRQTPMGQGGPLNTPFDSDFAYEKIDESNSILDNDRLSVDKLKTDYYYAGLAFTELIKMSKNYNRLLKDLPFGSPVPGKHIFTSGFGFRIHPIHKVLDMHQGIDLTWSYGTPIVSTAPGIVEKVEYNVNGYGWHLKISHKLGFSTLYAHLMSQPLVKPGDKVKKGQIIGYMGSTGTATGVHVHYEIRLGGNLKDPWPFVIAY